MRLPLICAAAGLAVATLAASSPAKADPYHLVRYADTGYCMIWDEALPTAPWPNNYVRVGARVPNLVQAIALKDSLLRAGTCSI
jgi:hypothetical protein